MIDRQVKGNSNQWASLIAHPWGIRSSKAFSVECQIREKVLVARYEAKVSSCT